MSPEKAPLNPNARVGTYERSGILENLIAYTIRQNTALVFDPRYEQRKPFMPLASMLFVLDNEVTRAPTVRHLRKLMALERASIPREVATNAVAPDRELMQRVELEAQKEMEKMRRLEEGDAIPGVWQQALTDWAELKVQIERELSSADSGD